MPKRKGKVGKNIDDINKISKNKINISKLDVILSDQQQTIEKLEQKLKYKKDKIEVLKDQLNKLEKSELPVIAVSTSTRKRRINNPSSDLLNLKSKRRRANETMDACVAIHGSSKSNIIPAVDGMIFTLTSKCKASMLATRILTSKKSLVNEVKNQCIKQFNSSTYHSETNTIRSVNVYYSQDVLGKKKYSSIRTANKSPNIVNFVPYKKLSEFISKIDIGNVQDIKPKYTVGLDNDDIGSGMYRNVLEFAPRLAKLYLYVNQFREDKLKEFDKYEKKNSTSFLFTLAIGGDEAPGSGTSFLLSFLNTGKRVASSSENYLLFGANVKENGIIVRRYLSDLVSQLMELESQIFYVQFPNKDRDDILTMPVEFKVGLLPNDLKMLAFLAGELSNASTYFTTFANVNKNDSNDYRKKYSNTGNSDWKPFSYEQRVSDAIKVEKRKAQILQSKSKAVSSQRTAITGYISKELKSRQEEVPLVKRFIDLSKCEPLHMKNNTVKEMFKKILEIVMTEANIGFNVKLFNSIADGNLFVLFVEFIRKNMNSNYLGNKVIAWFNDNQDAKRKAEFAFRFRGKESFNYLQGFPKLISFLISKVSQDRHRSLVIIFHQSLLLRQLVSYSVRIEDICREDVNKMKLVARELFVSCCLFNPRVSPSMWNFTNVAPSHTEECIEWFGLGLGLNTMEGREQKHQQIAKYAKKSTFQSRWSYVFRHEFIQLIYLKENGFDCTYYHKKNTKYIQDQIDGYCNCSLLLVDGKCNVCDSNLMKDILGVVANSI